MKSEFMLAITQLSAEKNLPKEVVLSAVETALVSAYRKDNFGPTQNLEVKIDPATGRVKVWAEKTVVEQTTDTRREISLAEANKINPDAQLGEEVMVEATPRNAGRIAAQTAKQVILQRLHEAEHSAIFEEYSDKEGDVVTGLVQRIEPRQLFVDLGRAEAILPAAEQVRTERYRIGQRLKVYLLEVMRTSRGPQVVVSRSHPDLLRRLFELEVPEVLNGTVELKAIAREAGYRSKIAVAARQEGIDPVGCCVGLRGIRIQNIMRELNGEKLDVVMWDDDVSAFIANALSPAQVISVELDKDDGIATVVVPDKQLSLAIGKEGQNARLAAKLTGWRIDIKSVSTAEEEKLSKAKPEPGVAEEAVVGAEPVAELPAIEEEVPAPEKEAEAEPEPATVLDTTLIPPEPFLEPQATGEKAQLRFAEDVLASGPTKSVAKSRKKKKKGAYERSADDGVRIKKQRRETEIFDEDEGEEY
ncbi:MAG TPA: transcription termination/antitermination protein NusA [Dehalococcoidia bacterium]|nr:transcription termination/antitermination protein NusA [Dehalococcoidia bacterium]